MVKSMTGFGKAVTENEQYRLEVEIRSVNHRFCDINLRMPRQFNAFDYKIRNRIKERTLRGKIDVTINFKYTGGDNLLVLNEALASDLYDKLQRLSQLIDGNMNYSVADFINFPNILLPNETLTDEDALFDDVERTVCEALDRLDDIRSAEGGHLAEDLRLKLNRIEEIVSGLTARYPVFMENYEARLHSRMDEIIRDYNLEERYLMHEVALMADKSCIDEELVRLGSHVQQVRATLNSGEPEVGRRLDFILQEFNREANTILSKANDMEITNSGIELKSVIEQIREQVQNLL